MQNMVMEDKLKEKIELSLLFDFYGELLKSHNKQIFADYILNDLSLGEIAEEQGISRQGVYDIVKRCGKQLKDCEEKLCLVKKFEQTRNKVNRIKELTVKIRTMHQKDDNTVPPWDYRADGHAPGISGNGYFNGKSGTENSGELAGLLEIIELTDNILQNL